jgi:transposase
MFVRRKKNRSGSTSVVVVENDVAVTINEEKIQEDAKWDGLKGYITNTTLTAADVVSQYRGLWVVERAFRVSKGTIETRPMFHFTERRIEAHVCLCFIAFKVYKELERLVRNLGLEMSADRVLKIAKTITIIKLRLPLNKQILTNTMMLTAEQRKLRSLFDHFGL